jgi:hypothetical protein
VYYYLARSILCRFNTFTLSSPLQGEPYVDSLHPYMDPLHPLVYNIFNKFAGCPCYPRRFHNLYNNPCFPTKLWHPLFPLHLPNFKEFILPLHNISEALPHLIINISSRSQMGISRNLIWLHGLRYHQLNINMHLTQGGPSYHHIQ